MPATNLRPSPTERGRDAVGHIPRNITVYDRAPRYSKFFSRFDVSRDGYKRKPSTIVIPDDRRERYHTRRAGISLTLVTLYPRREILAGGVYTLCAHARANASSQTPLPLVFQIPSQYNVIAFGVFIVVW